MRDGLLTGLFLRTLAPFVEDYNALREHFGLERLTGPRELQTEYHRADRRLILTSRAFDFALDPAPPNVRYVGPVLDDPHWLLGTDSGPGEHRTDDRPLVVVGFSSTYQRQETALRRAIEALGTLPVTALVSTGPALDAHALAAADLPDNVTLSRALSHAAVFPHASAVVTHAGHGTVMRALAAGAPLVCLPMGRDQDDNAAKVAYHGAGIRLSKAASPRTIASAVSRVMQEPSFREAAGRLGERIRQDVAEQRAVAELEGANDGLRFRSTRTLKSAARGS